MSQKIYLTANDNMTDKTQDETDKNTGQEAQTFVTHIRH